jgi:hypothetical protein
LLLKQNKNSWRQSLQNIQRKTNWISMSQFQASNSRLSNLGLKSAPPDWGLAFKQMSGKKSNKFHITVGFLCNTDGSEKWHIFFIGKSKKPHCFRKLTPQQSGFY